ncbi:hypothetical protein B2H97_08745 [Paraclostridium bifermentans]|uniref:hypothetical protein n=1 Tax=Paraclostridium bifermentans TaxID=1490 RepID=UPI0006B33200|nr:hypothetical protein [Paraclostridium bifermentans]OSB10051.1 hypothetical protein B2H97_08745 [Paraclostridium bifermentans]
MDKTQFLNYINKKLKNQINISKNWALRKVLEKPLEIISKVLIVPPIVFTGIMVFGMLILSSMSWFSISYFPDFLQIMDTKIIIGMIGVIISIIFAVISIVAWPIYIVVLIFGIWFIKTYRGFIKNHNLYKKANDLIDNL